MANSHLLHTARVHIHDFAGQPILWLATCIGVALAKPARRIIGPTKIDATNSTPGEKQLLAADNHIRDCLATGFEGQSRTFTRVPRVFQLEPGIAVRAFRLWFKVFQFGDTDDCLEHFVRAGEMVVAFLQPPNLSFAINRQASLLTLDTELVDIVHPVEQSRENRLADLLKAWIGSIAGYGENGGGDGQRTHQ